MKWVILLFLISCANTEKEPESKTGSCSHSQLSSNYSNSNCTGTVSNSVFKFYCTETPNFESCKTVTSCASGLYYNDFQTGSNQGCTAKGYPLACPGGFYKVASLTNCP